VDTIRELGINRVAVAACSPKTHEGIFRRVCMKAGLNPFLLEMINLRNQDSWVHKEQAEEATAKALDMVRMGVEKARLLVPLEAEDQPMVQRALVIGGGITGMAAATSLAQQGFDTHLVERRPQLGGMLRDLHELSPSGLDAADLIERQREAIEQAGVHLHVGTDIEMIGGHIGSFSARLSTGEEIRAGAVVLATGAQPYRPIEFGYGRNQSVITNLDLERAPETDADRVTFVACVGSRGGGASANGGLPSGCSRYCCESMIGQALRLRREGKKVRVLYRDIRTFSRHAEEMYESAMREGVQFLRYDPQRPPEEALSYRDGVVGMQDQLLGRRVNIPTDLLVLVVGLKPQDETVS
jgi:heterodisulfide reductase subunit A